MTLFFASCDCAGKYSSAGKHVPGCPMDSSCHFCGQKPFLCRMMGKCGGIAKLSKTFDLREQACKTIKGELTKQLNKIVQRLNLLINLGHVSEAFTEKIDALKAAFSKRQLDPKSLESAEKILLQLQRIYVTQKAASDKKVKEEDDAARAECDADDFMPGRAD
jgi:hypothetical protein